MSNDGSNQPYKNPSLPARDRVEDLIGRMTLDEKLAQLGGTWSNGLLDADGRLAEERARDALRHGIGHVTRIAGATVLPPAASAAAANDIQRFLAEQTRLGIPAIIHEESCAGFLARDATCFPQAIGLAATWEPAGVEEMTRVIRRQMRAVGAHHALAPVLDVARDPRWGRTEETFGEDPYLIAQMGIAYVRGLQGTDPAAGVVATGKHFLGYGASEGGMNWAPAHIPRRELLDVYLYPFEAVVKEAKLASVMNAYNEIDGIPMGASRELLTDLLRGEIGFDGVVVSDYFTVATLASYHHVAADESEAARLALEAGIDVELPALHCYGEPLRAAIADGRVPMYLVDDAVRRVLRMKLELGLFDRPYVDASAAAAVFDTAAQRQLALDIARKSLVLLKNDGDLLPLDKSIAIDRRRRAGRRQHPLAAGRLPLPGAPGDHVRPGPGRRRVAAPERCRRSGAALRSHGQRSSTASAPSWRPGQPSVTPPAATFSTRPRRASMPRFAPPASRTSPSSWSERSRAWWRAVRAASRRTAPTSAWPACSSSSSKPWWPPAGRWSSCS